MAVDKKPVTPKAIREFPRVGRYRIRLIEKSSREPGTHALDIREHVESEGFNGFTRRGIRLYTLDEVEELSLTITRILSEKLLPQKEEKPDVAAK